MPHDRGCYSKNKPFTPFLNWGETLSSLMKSKKSIVIGLVEVYRGVPVDFGHPVHRTDSDAQIGLVYGIERMASGFG